MGDFVNRRYWPTIKVTLSFHEQVRPRAVLDQQVIPHLGTSRLARLRREDIERWQAERREKVSGATKELMRRGELLGLTWADVDLKLRNYL